MALNPSMFFASTSASDRSILQTVLENWCEERNLPVSDPAAEVAASELLDLYNFGIETPDALLEMIRTI